MFMFQSLLPSPQYINNNMNRTEFESSPMSRTLNNC